MRNMVGAGWIPDIPDQRDRLYKVKRERDRGAKLSLRWMAGKPWDQGNLGSCTGHGVGRCDYVVSKATRKDFMPSRLMLYYNGRRLEGAVKQDRGAMIRDVIKGLVKYGACRESTWPYDEHKFAKVPSKKAQQEGMLHQAIVYERVPQAVSAIRSCLQDGFPVTFGAMLYSSFDNVGEDGFVTLPSKDEGPLGGHCMTIIGHDPWIKRFEVINSWGEDWGQGGYCWFPEPYILNTNLCDDFWVIRKME